MCWPRIYFWFVILADCGRPPTIARATVRLGETTEGAVRTYICDADTKANGDPTITCQNDGQWTISTLTCESKPKSRLITCLQGQEIT